MADGRKAEDDTARSSPPPAGSCQGQEGRAVESTSGLPQGERDEQSAPPATSNQIGRTEAGFQHGGASRGRRADALAAARSEKAAVPEGPVVKRQSLPSPSAPVILQDAPGASRHDAGPGSNADTPAVKPALEVDELIRRQLTYRSALQEMYRSAGQTMVEKRRLHRPSSAAPAGGTPGPRELVCWDCRTALASLVPYAGSCHLCVCEVCHARGSTACPLCRGDRPST